MHLVKNRNLLVLEIILATGIFIIDMYTPRGIADAISYVALVLLTLWSDKKSHTLIAAVGATLLTITGGFFSPAGESTSVFMVNRSLAIIGVWAAAAVMIRFKTYEAEGRRLKDSLNALFTYATEGIIITDAEGKIEMINPEAEKQFGYEPHELVGKTIEALVPARDAEKHKHHRERFNQQPRARVMGAGMELMARRKDNSEFPVEISLSTYLLDKARYTVAFIIDITERKSRELQLKQSHDELKQYAAMLKDTNAELESFAYISSHDLQEPLRKIQSFGSRIEIEESAHLSETGKDYLARILNAAERMQNLINDLLTYSRLTTRDKVRTDVDLNEIAREVITDLEVSIEKNNARITINPLPKIAGEPTQMRQLFQNLIGNAIKFRKPDTDPNITISSRNIEVEGRRYAELVFEDNGIGFDEKYAEKIFGIFQRLDGAKFEGSGIGLTICKKIAARHGGIITAESTLGSGSVFTVTFPLTPHIINTETYATQKLQSD